MLCTQASLLALVAYRGASCSSAEGSRSLQQGQERLCSQGLAHSSLRLSSPPPAQVFLPCPSHPCPQATEDQMRLLRLQRCLEDELGGRFLDLSVHDTVTTLILGGHNKRAEQVARDFRIPDKR